MPSDQETAASPGLQFLHLGSEKLERDDIGGPSRPSILSLHLNTAFLIPNKRIFRYTRLFLCLHKGDLIPQVNKQIRETVEREPGRQGTADEKRGLRGGEGEEGGSRGAFYKSQSQAGRASRQGGELQPPLAFFILWCSFHSVASSAWESANGWGGGVCLGQTVLQGEKGRVSGAGASKATM